MRKARRMALGRQYVRFVPKKHNMIDLSVIQDITSKIAGRAGWRVAPVAPKLPLRQTLTIRLSAGTARVLSGSWPRCTMSISRARIRAKPSFRGAKASAQC